MFQKYMIMLKTHQHPSNSALQLKTCDRKITPSQQLKILVSLFH